MAIHSADDRPIFLVERIHAGTAGPRISKIIDDPEYPGVVSYGGFKLAFDGYISVDDRVAEDAELNYSVQFWLQLDNTLLILLEDIVTDVKAALSNESQQ